jgi:predicted acylesterase/phospholipase RssA
LGPRKGLGRKRDAQRALPSGPLKVQLAVQGGGAKISSLLAVLEAFQESPALKPFTFTRLAGTSAGSIIVTCLAANIRARELRQRLKDGGARDLVRNLFPVPNWLSAVGLALLNRPLWNEKKLGGLLRTELESAGLQELSFAELNKKGKCEVMIVATDLTSSKRVVFDNRGSESLISAILHSCGIPFYYRTSGSTGNVLVDGGITENFPAELLNKELHKYGPVLGIGFKEKTWNPPSGLIGVGSALLNTAMTESTRRARKHIEDGNLFLIDTNVDTFDFQAGFESLAGAEYDLIYEKAQAYFEKVADRLRARHGRGAPNPVVDPKKDLAEMMRRNFEIYCSQQGHVKMRILFASCVVQVNALCELSGDADEERWAGDPDMLSYTIRFEAATEPLYAHRVVLEPTPGTLTASDHTDLGWQNVDNWSLHDKYDQRRRVVVVPAKDDAHPDERVTVLHFADPIEPGSDKAPFTLRFRDSGIAAYPLKERKADTFGLHFQRAEGAIDRAEFVLHLPRRITPVSLKQPSAGSAAPGREMRSGELANYQPQNGFVAYGWVAENIQPGTVLQFEVTLT